MTIQDPRLPDYDVRQIEFGPQAVTITYAELEQHPAVHEFKTVTVSVQASEDLEAAILELIDDACALINEAMKLRRLAPRR